MLATIEQSCNVPVVKKNHLGPNIITKIQRAYLNVISNINFL